MTRAHLGWPAVTAALLLAAILPARAAALDTVLAALAEEEKAPAERVRMFVQRGATADLYYIDRVRPGRTRLQKNPAQGGMEMIVIGNRQWLRDGSAWRQSTMPAVPADLVPPITGLFRKGLADAVEKLQPNGGRVVDGTITWTGSTSCAGQIHMLIDTAGRPALLHFEGTCNKEPAHFRQAFDYPAALSIDPPS